MALRLPIAHKQFGCLYGLRPIGLCKWKQRDLCTPLETMEQREALPAGGQYVLCHFTGARSKRFLPWCKFYRDIITSIGRVRVIKTAVAFGPLFVPRTGAIWDEIMSARLFADPKDCCYNACFPRVPLRLPKRRTIF